MKPEIDYEAQFAGFFDSAGDLAREIALKYFRKEIPVDEKNDKSPVTQADREIEQRLRELIGKKFPNHGIIGEEYGTQNAGAEFVWVIDPIDGTKSFATGRPLFGTILGLIHGNTTAVGMIEQAYTKERWFGIAHQYAQHNGKLIKVAPPRLLEDARLYTGSIAMFDDEHFNNYLSLCRAAKWTQYSCDCYAYGLLSMGWTDIVVEQKLGLHDIAGIAPIVTGAGGFISDWNGNAIDASFNGQAIAASSVQLAQQAMSLLNRR